MEVLLATLYILLRPGQTYLSAPPMEAAQLKKMTERLLAFVHTDNLKEYVTGGEVEQKVTVTFYKSSSSVIDLSHITLDDTDQLLGMDIPIDDHLSALMSIRRKYFDDRELLTTIHLIALANYLFYSASAALENTIFLYEPDLVSKVAEFIPLSDPICAAALSTLDALMRHKTKVSEVLTAIGINLNHGPLFTVLRQIANQERSYDVVDATMSILGYLIEFTQHSSILTGAGILPILLDITGVPDVRIVPRACGIIDNLVLGQLHGMQMLSNADGVNIVVNRIKNQVDNAQVQEHPLLSDENARLYSMQPLQKLLRTIQSLMKASGASEGMRNLVDGELPKSIQKIFENHAHYGTRVFALAISVMTTFINNEPTSLSILQEMGLPQSLYSQLETAVPATTESTIGNAISAICLNTAGLDLTKERPAIIRNLIRTSIQESDKALEPDASAVGMSMEELARHQHALRPIIEKATMEEVQAVIADAETFVPPEDQLMDYHLDKIRRDGTVVSVTTNSHLVRLARLFRFLEGFARDSTSCTDLIKEGLLPMLLHVLELPCIPVRFGTTEAATTFSHLIRGIGKHDHIKLAEAFIEAIDKQSIFLDAEKWAAFDKGEAMDADFRKLRTVAAAVTYFAEFLAGLTAFTHHRMTTSLLKVIKPEFLHRLGELVQMGVTQHAGLKTAAPENTEVGFDTETHDNGKESGAKFLATRTYAMITRFFRSILRMTFVKRVPDVTKSPEAREIIGAISQIMNNAFSAPSLPGKEAATLVQAVCFNASLLFEDSKSSLTPLIVAVLMSRPQQRPSAHSGARLRLRPAPACCGGAHGAPRRADSSATAFSTGQSARRLQQSPGRSDTRSCRLPRQDPPHPLPYHRAPMAGRMAHRRFPRNGQIGRQDVLGRHGRRQGRLARSACRRHRCPATHASARSQTEGKSNGQPGIGRSACRYGFLARRIRACAYPGPQQYRCRYRTHFESAAYLCGCARSRASPSRRTARRKC